MIYGYAHTEFSKVYEICKKTLGSSLIQFLTKEDSVVRKRCYIVLGVSILDKVKIASLNSSSGILIVVDSLPALQLIKDIQLLDCIDNQICWKTSKANFKPLIKALQSKPKLLQIALKKDSTLDDMISIVANRSVLDRVLAVAKLISPDKRNDLHNYVAQYINRKLSFKAFKIKIERLSSGRKASEMLQTLQSEKSKRLSLALQAHLKGLGVQEASKIHDVEASEIRFLATHLKGGK